MSTIKYQIILEVLLKLCADVKNRTLLQDFGESYNINDNNTQ